MAIIGLSCMWGGAGAGWPHPSAFKYYYRDNRNENARYHNSIGQNPAIVMSSGAQNMSGEQPNDANTQFIQQLKETV